MIYCNLVNIGMDPTELSAYRHKKAIYRQFFRFKHVCLDYEQRTHRYWPGFNNGTWKHEKSNEQLYEITRTTSELINLQRKN